MPTIPVRLEEEIWKAFRVKLIEEGKSAQEFFKEKVEEYIREA